MGGGDLTHGPYTRCTKTITHSHSQESKIRSLRPKRSAPTTLKTAPSPQPEPPPDARVAHHPACPPTSSKGAPPVQPPACPPGGACARAALHARLPGGLLLGRGVWRRPEGGGGGPAALAGLCAPALAFPTTVHPRCLTRHHHSQEERMRQELGVGRRKFNVRGLCPPGSHNNEDGRRPLTRCLPPTPRLPGDGRGSRAEPGPRRGAGLAEAERTHGPGASEPWTPVSRC